MQNLFSRLLGILLLVAMAPTMALGALAVRLESRGPVLRRYARIDRRGRTFDAWAFRIHKAAVPNGTSIAPQLTVIGRVLWWTRLDELPIVFNLVAGTARIAFGRESTRRNKSGIEITIVANKTPS